MGQLGTGGAHCPHGAGSCDRAVRAGERVGRVPVEDSGDAVIMDNLTVWKVPILVSDEEAIALLDAVNALCLPEGTATMDEMEAVGKQIDDAIVRVKHDLARMESMK